MKEFLIALAGIAAFLFSLPPLIYVYTLWSLWWLR